MYGFSHRVHDGGWLMIGARRKRLVFDEQHYVCFFCSTNVRKKIFEMFFMHS